MMLMTSGGKKKLDNDYYWPRLSELSSAFSSCFSYSIIDWSSTAAAQMNAEIEERERELIAEMSEYTQGGLSHPHYYLSFLCFLCIYLLGSKVELKKELERV